MGVPVHYCLGGLRCYLHFTAEVLSPNPPRKHARWQSVHPSAHSPLASRPPFPTWQKGRRQKVGQADLLVPSIKRSAWVKGTGRVAAEFFIKDIPQFPACSAQGAQVTAEPSHQCWQIQPDILTPHTMTQRETLNYGWLARKLMMTWLQDKTHFNIWRSQCKGPIYSRAAICIQFMSGYYCDVTEKFNIWTIQYNTICSTGVR